MPCFGKPFSFVCVAALVLVGARKKTRRLSNGPRPGNRCLGNFAGCALLPRRGRPMRRPGGGFCPTRGIRAYHGNPFYRRCGFEEGYPLLLSTRGHSRRNSTLRKPIWPSPGPLWIRQDPVARVQDLVESKPLQGRTTTPGKTPSTWAKPRSSRIKPPSSPRV